MYVCIYLCMYASCKLGYKPKEYTIVVSIINHNHWRYSQT